MNHNDSSIYCVVKFMEFPFKGDYVCIPSSWVRVRKKSNTTVLVSYPDKHLKNIERRVRQRQGLDGAWHLHTADVKYSTDSYDDAQNFINGQFDDVQNEHRQPNVENKGDELSASEYSNENQLSPPRADVSIENSYTRETPVEKSQKDNWNEETTDLESDELSASESESETDLERNTNNTTSVIQNSSNLANQSLGPITINKDNFCSNFSTFFNDVESVGDINQLYKLFDENPEMAKKELKKVIDRRNRNSNIPTASTSKDTKAKVAKASGKKRNKEKEQNDDDDGNGEDQVLKKKRCFNPKFDLPPEYDKNDTRWTLKYPTSAPGLVELMPDTDVYINAEKLSRCKRLAKDCNTLARILLTEIFKTSALSTCSWTGARAPADTFGAHIRPGLDEDARNVLVAFVTDYGRTVGWVGYTECILNSIRDKIQKMRP